MESGRVGEINGHQYFLYSLSQWSLTLIQPEHARMTTRKREGPWAFLAQTGLKHGHLDAAPLLPYELPRISCNNLTQRLTT